MQNCARRLVPALVAILYLGSSTTPCSIAAGGIEGLGSGGSVAAVEVASDGHHQHPDEASPDETVGAPCPCGCRSESNSVPAAKRLATAVLLMPDSETPSVLAVEPSVLAVFAVEGQRQLPDPIPIPS